MSVLGLTTLGLHFGGTANVQAGGASLLQLPIEGITAENQAQCKQLFEKTFRPILINWKNGDAKIIKDGSTDMIVLRPDHGQISLSDVERALKGSPFSIKRDQLEYFSLLRLRIKKVVDYQTHVKALATLDGKKLQTHSVENKDGSIWITFRDVTRNSTTPRAEKRKRSLITHQRLTSYCTQNKINLLEVSWGRIPFLDDRTSWSDGGSGTRPEIWRGDYFGARLAPKAKAGEEKATL